MDRKKIMYIGIIFIITVITSITYFSYGFLTSKNEYHGRVNMIVGTLDYELKSSDLDSNNSITLNANETKKIEIEITSLNTIASKYELYYQTESNDIEVGYSSDTVDNPAGELGSKNSKKVTVVIKNKSASSATVTFGVQGGFTYNELVLSEGRISTNQELNICQYNPGDVVKEAGYTGAADLFEVPCEGNYKLEVWGASGLNKDGVLTNSYGRGAYTSGKIELSRKTKLYMYVGGNAEYLGGGYMFNGGGAGEAPGGGATDVRFFGSTQVSSSDLVWDSDIGLKSRIMVAGGGGGGMYEYHTSLVQRGDAGGLTGYDALGGYEYSNNRTDLSGHGGTQTTGGASGVSINTGDPLTNLTSGSFGKGGYSDLASGGGSGYYGGGHGTHPGDTWPGGGGGSSFISGHAGSLAITSSESTSIKTGCNNLTDENKLECSTHYSGLVFKDTKMIDGAGYSWTNVKGSLEQMPNPNGGYYESGTGHTGDGYARITYLGNEKYTISFNTNGGNDIDSRTVLQENTIGELPTPTRGTDIFEGWYLEDTFTTKVDSTYVPTGDVTLYARYGVEVNMNLAGRTSGTPSNTAGANTTKRTWNTNTYVNGVSSDNYYSNSFFTSSSFGANSVTVASGCGYGVVIPMSLEKGKTYVITTGGAVGYASDGTHLGIIRLQTTTNGREFTVPSNAQWVLFLYGGGGECTATGAKQTKTYSNIHLYKLD